MELELLEYEGRKYAPQDIIEKLKTQVTEKRWQRIQDVVEKRRSHLATVLENIYDQGNSAAVMRSAEAFGFYQVHHIVGITRFKESRRISQGAEKWLLQKKWPNTVECVKSLKAQGYRIAVTQLEGARPISEVDWSQPTALCFGSEKEGVSPELSALADERVFVPMQGFVQSFNISVAAALCFQWVFHNSTGHNPLSGAEKKRLQALYLLRSCPRPLLPPPVDEG